MNRVFTQRNNIEMSARMVVFERVAREGGFSPAARALGISKANVSKQVAQLEDTLGVRLLQRTTRVVKLTEAGLHFLERCQQLTRLVNEAGDLLSSMQDQVMGRMRISIPSSFGREFLEAPVADFAQQFPKLELEVEVTDQSVDLVQGDYDVSIRVGPVREPDLVTRKLCTTQKLVVCAPRLLAETPPLEGPADLSHQPCLIYTHQIPKDIWRFRGSRGVVEVPVFGRIRSSSGDFLATAARRGLGFAWLPDFIVKQDLARGDLVTLFEANYDHIDDVQAVLPARKFVPLKVREFLTHLEHHFAPQ